MLIDVASFAALIQCNEESVRRWIRAGKMQAIKLPGGLKIDLAAVDLPHDTRSRLIAEWRAALTRAAEKALVS